MAYFNLAVAGDSNSYRSVIGGQMNESAKLGEFREGFRAVGSIPSADHGVQRLSPGVDGFTTGIQATVVRSHDYTTVRGARIGSHRADASIL